MTVDAQDRFCSGVSFECDGALGNDFATQVDCGNEMFGGAGQFCRETTGGADCFVAVCD